MKLNVPAATRALCDCRTENGVSPQVAVPVTYDGALSALLDPKAASGTRAGIGNDDEASVDEG